MATMRRKIPSTTALAVFEAAARHQSYTKAADELAVTQSAVCRQIASLEDFLGVRLFQRNRRGVALTEAGEGYGRLVRSRLDDVERDALDLMSRGKAGVTLELATVPTFATKWLLPRLSGFIQRNHGIQLNLTSRTRPSLVPPFLVEDELVRGLLSTVSRQPVQSDRGYHLLSPEHKARGAALVAFGTWLQGQILSSPSGN